MPVRGREGLVGLVVHGERGADVEKDLRNDFGWVVRCEGVSDAGAAFP